MTSRATSYEVAAVATPSYDAVGIRPMEDSDWPQVHDLVVEVATAGETYAREIPGSVGETRDFWEGQHLVVAVDGDAGGGQVLGSAKMGPNRPAQGSHIGTASFMVGSAS